MKKKMTLLFVEDDPSLLEGCVDLMEIIDIGFDLKVLSAMNGEEALAIMADHRPDLIVSGVMMPRMGGYALLQKVRETPEWSEIPFLFLTTRSDTASVVRGLAMGADAYILKPYKVEDLLEVIQEELNFVSVFQDNIPEKSASELSASRIRALHRRLHRLQEQSRHALQLVEEYVHLEQKNRALTKELQELKDAYETLLEERDSVNPTISEKESGTGSGEEDTAGLG